MYPRHPFVIALNNRCQFAIELTTTNNLHMCIRQQQIILEYSSRSKHHFHLFAWHVGGNTSINPFQSFFCSGWLKRRPIRLMSAPLIKDHVSAKLT